MNEKITVGHTQVADFFKKVHLKNIKINKNK